MSKKDTRSRRIGNLLKEIGEDEPMRTRVNDAHAALNHAWYALFENAIRAELLMRIGELAAAEQCIVACGRSVEPLVKVIADLKARMILLSNEDTRHV